MKRITGRRVARASMVLVLGMLLALMSQGVAARPALQQEGAVPVAAAGVLGPSSTLVSYQGTLTDQNGNPVNATVTIKFALYDAASVGNLKWGTETQSVQVTNGLFNVLLGSVTPIDPASLTGDLWLDIKVNNEQLTPREKIASVPYAVEASTLPDGAETRGSLQVNGSLTAMLPYIGMNRLRLVRPDEGGRTHEWAFWHMNQEYYMNSLQIYEYRTDSNGISCGGNPADGAVCDPRFTISPGGNVGIGTTAPAAKLEIAATEGYALIASGPTSFWGAVGIHDNLYVDSGLTAGGSLAVSGLGFFGGATFSEGAVNLQSAAVPLTFKEVNTDGTFSLWRMPVDGGLLRFDSSDNGTDFTAYHTAITMYPNGSIGCGAITENNLQTEEEQAAGGSDRFEEGDVLCWGIDRLEKCAAANDRLVQAVADASGRPIVIGAEVVKVLGPVKRGDILVASSVPGYAMVNNDPASGSVIAQALEDFDGERGIIKAMIRKW